MNDSGIILVIPIEKSINNSYFTSKINLTCTRDLNAKHILKYILKYRGESLYPQGWGKLLKVVMENTNHESLINLK